MGFISLKLMLSPVIATPPPLSSDNHVKDLISHTLELPKPPDPEVFVTPLLKQRDAQIRQAEEARIAAENARKAAEAQKQAEALAAIQKAAAVAYVPIPGGNEAWMRAAGIPESDWVYVRLIVNNESGWNPCSYYPGQHNCAANPVALGVACGLVQQNPCGKIPGDWKDPVAALIWQKTYVLKYGGYAGAWAFWQIHHAY